MLMFHKPKGHGQKANSSAAQSQCFPFLTMKDESKEKSRGKN